MATIQALLPGAARFRGGLFGLRPGGAGLILVKADFREGNRSKTRSLVEGRFRSQTEILLSGVNEPGGLVGDEVVREILLLGL